MITRVRSVYHMTFLNATLFPSKFVYFHEILHCCNGRRLTLLVSAESAM